MRHPWFFPGALILALVGSPAFADEAPPAPQTSPEAVLQAGSWSEGIRETAAALGALSFDATQVSLAALARSFRTPEEARSWVDNSIGWDLYDGGRRGARATLLAGSGNSLDRALLLGALLGEAGHDWRLVGAELQEDSISELLSARIPRGRLLGSAVPSGIVGYSPLMDVQARMIASHHYWVEVRERRGGWTQLDPTFPAGSTPALVTGSRRDLASGQGTQAPIRISILKRGSSGRTEVVLSHEGDAEALAYRNLSLRVRAEGDELALDLGTGGTASHSARVGTAGLQELLLQVDLPGINTQRKQSVVLYDTSGAFAGELQRHAIVLLPGPVGDDYFQAVLSVLYRDIGANLPPVEGRSAADLEAALAEPLQNSLGVLALSMARALDSLAAAVALRGGGSVVHESPRLVIASAYHQGAELSLSLDLQAGDLRTQVFTGVPAAVGFAIDAIQSRAAASLPAILLSRMGATNSDSLAGDFEAAQRSGAQLITAHQGTLPRLSSLPLPAVVRGILERIVQEQGSLALAPNRAEDGGAYPWWEFHPGTAAVGYGRYGSRGTARGTAPTSASSESARQAEATLWAIHGVGRLALELTGDPTVPGTALCEASCALPRMARATCSDERQSTPPSLAACLRGDDGRRVSSSILSGDPCRSQTKAFSCGSLVAQVLSRNTLWHEAEAGPGAVPSRGESSTFSWGVCECGSDSGG